MMDLKGYSLREIIATWLNGLQMYIEIRKDPHLRYHFERDRPMNPGYKFMKRGMRLVLLIIGLLLWWQLYTG